MVSRSQQKTNLSGSLKTFIDDAIYNLYSISQTKNYFIFANHTSLNPLHFK